MAKNFIALKDVDPKGSHSYLIDTNMWVYLFSPIGSTQQKLQDSIGKFIENCQRVDAGIVTTSFIVAEFFHVTLGISFDQWVKARGSSNPVTLKKDFRPTDEYAESIHFITSTIEKICKIATRQQDSFETIDVDNVLKNCSHAEYFDNHMLELSNQKKWFIVSNDRDLLEHPDRTTTIIVP